MSKEKFALYFLTSVFCFGIVSSEAASWYVDTVARGNGTGSPDWNNAATLSTVHPAAGDTVYISGGVTSKTYSVSSWDPPRGVAGNPVTYRTGQDSGNNGTVIFDGGGSSFWIHPLQWSSAVKNFVISGNVNGQAHMTVQNYGDNVVYSADSGSDSSSNITFSYINFPQMKGMFRLYNTSSVEIDHCNIEKINGGNIDDTVIIGPGGGGTSFTSVKIHDNNISLTASTTDGAWGEDGIKWISNASIYNNHFKVIYTNYPGTQHCDLIQTGGVYLKIYNNVFENVGESVIYIDLTQPGQASTNLQIYNNVIYQSAPPTSGVARGFDIGAEGSNAGTVTFTDAFVSNNTFIDSPGNAIRWILFKTCTRCYISNNLLYSSGGILYDTGVDGTKINDLANKQLSGSPAPFKSYSRYSPGNTGELSSSASVIDKGDATFISNAFNTDMIGNPRPQGAAWDVGAYEYCSGGACVSPSPTPTPTPPPVGPVTWYVRTTGSNSNPGTSASPWQTIQYAVSNANVNAGDTILVGNGSYGEDITISKSGTSSSAKLTVKAENRRQATSRSFNITGSFVRLEAFDITNGGANSSGITSSGNNVEIIDNSVRIVGRYGISANGSNVVISSNYVFQPAIGITIGGTNGLVENNDIERLKYWGFLGDADNMRFSGSGHLIRNNHFYGTLAADIGAGHVDGFQTFDDGGTVADRANNIIIERNIVEGFHHEGMMMEAAFQHASSGITIRNNIFVGSQVWGVCAVRGLKNVFVYNNVFANMANHSVGLVDVNMADPSTGEVVNNIFYNVNPDSNYGVYFSTPGTVNLGRKNLIQVRNAGTVSQSTYPNDQVNMDPLFVNAAGGVFHLTANSPAINQGATLNGFSNDLDGIARPQGPAWDIGPFEYTGIVTQVTYHPGDADQNMHMTLNEATQYGFCWKSAPAVPSGCPGGADLNNATRAGLLYGSTVDGIYHFDSTKTPPACWIPGQ